MNFASTWNKLLKYCISAKFLLMEGYVQGALREKLHIAPFVERLKTATFGKVLIINFAKTWNKLLKHCISAKFWLMEGYVQGALR